VARWGRRGRIFFYSQPADEGGAGGTLERVLVKPRIVIGLSALVSKGVLELTAGLFLEVTDEVPQQLLQAVGRYKSVQLKALKPSEWVDENNPGQCFGSVHVAQPPDFGVRHARISIGQKRVLDCGVLL
jgi:hypothetical protein